MSLPFWFTLLLFTKGKGPLPTKAILLGTGVLVWTALMYYVVKGEIALPFVGKSPLRTPVYFVIPVGLVLLFRRWMTKEPFSQHLLVSLQLFRLIGMVFVLEWWRGVLPAVFAQPAGWGDLLTSVIAVYILVRYRKTAIPRNALVALGIVGLIDIASAFFFGIASASTPLQILSFELPNRVSEYPTGLIPGFLVPFAVAGHILSLSQLPKS